MSENEPTSEAFVASLSQSEREVLTTALSKTEWQLYQLVLKRLRIWLAIIASALTLFGVATFTTLRTATVEAAANKLATDADLRNQVVADATKKMQRVNAVVANAERLQADIDSERGRALAIVRADLSQIVQMTTQLHNDVATHRSNRGTSRQQSNVK